MHSYENVPLGAGGSQRLGGADQTGVRVGPNSLSPVWRGDENHRLHRAASDRGDREDSAPLRTVGGASGTRPALGEGLGCGLRLRASGTGGAVAPRARRGICSTVNCTLDGQRQHRFQPLWCPERPCWRLRLPSRRAGGRPAAPKADQAPARGDNCHPQPEAHSSHVEKANAYQCSEPPVRPGT